MRSVRVFGYGLLLMGAVSIGLGVSNALASTDGCNMQVLHDPNALPGTPPFMHHPTMQCNQAVCDDMAPCESSPGMDAGGTYVICMCDESSSETGPICMTKKYFNGSGVTNVVCINNGCLPSPPMQCVLQTITVPPVMYGTYFEVRCKCIYSPGGGGD